MSATATARDSLVEFENPDRYHPFETHAQRLAALGSECTGQEAQLLNEAHRWLSPLTTESWTSLRRAADHAARLLGLYSRPAAGETLLATLVSRVDSSISRLESVIETRRVVRPYVKRIHREAQQAYTILVVL